MEQGDDSGERVGVSAGPVAAAVVDDVWLALELALGLVDALAVVEPEGVEPKQVLDEDGMEPVRVVLSPSRQSHHGS